MPDLKNFDIIIAIDGPSSSGKSTLAKDLAKKLSYRYIDSGAMYRAVTLYLLRQEVSYQETNNWDFLENEIHLDFQLDQDVNKILLNQEDVSELIRSAEVNEHVSLVAALSPVRSFLVKSQQAMGQNGGLVMDGRDIGTVVFPEAQLKIFLQASFEIRAERRFKEQLAKGMNQTMEDVKQNLQLRDFIDSNREDSPLFKATDALVLKNDDIDLEEQLNICYKWAKEKMQSLKS